MAFRDGLTHRAAIMRRERGTTDTWLTVDDVCLTLRIAVPSRRIEPGADYTH